MASKNTLPERKIQDSLTLRGVNFETHVNELPGTPDIVLCDSGLVIFVHGCYWHKHSDCSRAARHSSKIPLLHLLRNAAIARDVRIVKELRGEGKSVFVAWECHIANSSTRVVEKILSSHWAVLQNPGR